MTKLTTPCLCLPLAFFPSTTKVVLVCFAIIALFSISNKKIYWLYVFVRFFIWKTKQMAMQIQKIKARKKILTILTFKACLS